MAKRHRWSRGNGWCVCVDCGSRYRTGNLIREYEQPYGGRTATAVVCIPREQRSQRVEPPNREPHLTAASGGCMA